MSFGDRKVLFYDGECGFCNRSVQVVLKHQQEQKPIYFARLQSDEAQLFLQKNGVQHVEWDTLYFYTGKKLLQKSNAVLHIAHHMHWPYNLFSAFFIIPRTWRDKVYDMIAKRRHRLVRNPSCRLPDPEQRKLFID